MQKCPFCGCDMKAHTHSDLNFASPQSLELMSLSILHFLLHIFIHIRNLGYRWTVKTWKKRNMDWVEIDRRTEEVNKAFEKKGLTKGSSLIGHDVAK